MKRQIPVIVTMDTKGPEALFLKEFIERRGFDAPIIDVGTRQSRFDPDYPYDEVADRAGVTLDELAAMRRDNMMRTMGEGASQILLEYWAKASWEESSLLEEIRERPSHLSRWNPFRSGSRN